MSAGGGGEDRVFWGDVLKNRFRRLNHTFRIYNIILFAFFCMGNKNYMPRKILVGEVVILQVTQVLS